MAGAIGVNGVNVPVRAVVAFQCKIDNVIIRRRPTVVHFVWANVFAIKYAIKSRVQKMNQALGHNNVHNTMIKHSETNSTNGYRILIVVSVRCDILNIAKN